MAVTIDPVNIPLPLTTEPTTILGLAEDIVNVDNPAVTLTLFTIII